MSIKTGSTQCDIWRPICKTERERERGEYDGGIKCQLKYQIATILYNVNNIQHENNHNDDDDVGDDDGGKSVSDNESVCDFIFFKW